MTTAANYKAVITTEIHIPLNKIPEENISKAICKDGMYLREIEACSNVRIEWDKKGAAIYIYGEPKAAKHAYNKIIEQMSDISSTKGTSVNLLGKEFTDGVLFRKLHGAATKSDDGNGLQSDDMGFNRGGKENIPSTFVLDPTIIAHIKKERGRIMASELWRSVNFVGWDFKEDVIQDASTILRIQLKRLPIGQGKRLKLEMNIGKVVFSENNKNKYPLEGTRFTISDFRHLRFTKEITSTFRKEWHVSWTARLRAILQTLGYDRDGNTLKTVKIYHTSQCDDGKFCKNVWSADILDGKRLGDKKPGALEFLKSRVYESSSFSTTVYSPARSFDFRFSIIVNARESPESTRQIEERIRRSYRYSFKRGLLVNNMFENDSGYKPLAFPKARLIHETTWIRGDIKVFILEVQDGPNSTFEVKAQSNLLKKYIREVPGEVPLTNVIEALTSLFEAVEEINGELNVLEAEISPEPFSKPTRIPERNSKSLTGKVDKSVTSHGLYHTPETDRAATLCTHPPPQIDKFMVMATSAGITVRKEFNNKLLLNTSPQNVGEALNPFRLPPSPVTCIPRTEFLWEGRVVGIIDDLGVGTPVYTPTKKAQQDPSPKVDKVLSKEVRSSATDNGRDSDNLIVNEVEHNTVDHTQLPVVIPPHIRPFTKSPIMSPGNTSPTTQASSSYNNFSDRFFDLLDSTADGDSNTSVDVLTPKVVASPRSVKMRIDFFGSVEPSIDNDDDDLISWSPKKNAFTYIRENSFEFEGGDGINLLLD